MFPLLHKRLMATFVAYGNCNIFSRCCYPFTCPLSPLCRLMSPPSAALIMHLLVHVAYADRIRILCTLSLLYTSVCVCVSCICMYVWVYVLSMCVCLFLCGSLMNKMQLVHFVAFVRLAYSSSSCRCFNYVDDGEGRREMCRMQGRGRATKLLQMFC